MHALPPPSFKSHLHMTGPNLTPSPTPLVRTCHVATAGQVVPDRAAVWQRPRHSLELGGQTSVDKQTFPTHTIFCIFSVRRKISPSPLETALG